MLRLFKLVFSSVHSGLLIMFSVSINMDAIDPRNKGIHKICIYASKLPPVKLFLPTGLREFKG